MPESATACSRTAAADIACCGSTLERERIHVSGDPTAYVRGQALSFNFCANCGFRRRGDCGFYNVIERTVAIDGAQVRVAGLNNLVTMPAHRGRGVASRLLRETQPRWFDSIGAECGLLLCADALLPFYSRLDWEKVEARVSFAQPAGLRVWPANCMLLSPHRQAAATREIDLCGLPW